MADITGTASDDYLVGAADGDVIERLSGNDALSGLAGSDRLKAGDGDDHLEGATGHDFLDGGLGSDTLIGGDDDDFLTAYVDGDDLLDGSAGNDQISIAFDIWSSDDAIVVPDSVSMLVGGAGDDVFVLQLLRASNARIEVDGDRIEINGYRTATAKLGAGQDIIDISENDASYQTADVAPIVVSDFQADDAGDSCVWNEFLHLALTNYDRRSNPFPRVIYSSSKMGPQPGLPEQLVIALPSPRRRRARPRRHQCCREHRSDRLRRPRGSGQFRHPSRKWRSGNDIIHVHGLRGEIDVSLGAGGDELQLHNIMNDLSQGLITIRDFEVTAAGDRITVDSLHGFLRQLGRR